MSAVLHDPDPAAGDLARIECVTCPLPFAATSDREEATFLAGVHNSLHHGGRREAVLSARVVELDDSDGDDWS